MFKYKIALRYLLRRRIAYVSIVAITFGVMAMIVVMSVMDGFQEDIKTSIRSIDASLSLRLSSPSPIYNPRWRGEVEETLSPFIEGDAGLPEGSWAEDTRHFDVAGRLLDEFEEETGERVIARSKRTTTFVLASRRINSERAANKGLQLIGIDPDLERRVLPFERILEAVTESASSTDVSTRQRAASRDVPDKNHERPFRVVDSETGLPDGDPGIILGIYLADQLNVRRGDHLTLSTARMPEGGFSGSEEVDVRTERVVVAGCFETGRYDYDSAMAFCNLEFLNQLLGQAGDCAEIHCRIDDPERANEVKEKLLDRYGAAINITTWIDRMGPLAEALDVEKGVMMIIMFFIVLVAGASILGILYMLVLEKTRDVGILLSMGATPGGITAIFLLYGAMLGALGTSLGTFLGLEVVWNINAITAFLDQSLGIEVFPARIYQFNELPTQINPREITVLAVSTFLISLLAAALPALRASRLNPVKCLSYE